MKNLFITWNNGTTSRFSVPDDYSMRTADREEILNYTAGEGTHAVDVELSIDWDQVNSACLTTEGYVEAVPPGPNELSSS